MLNEITVDYIDLLSNESVDQSRGTFQFDLSETPPTIHSRRIEA